MIEKLAFRGVKDVIFARIVEEEMVIAFSERDNHRFAICHGDVMLVVDVKGIGADIRGRDVAAILLSVEEEL